MNERWTNWSGAVSCAPHAVAPAHDEAEIAAIVHVAGREGRTVRPLGSGHSSSPLCVADDGVLLSLERWKGVLTAAQADVGPKWRQNVDPYGEPLCRETVAVLADHYSKTPHGNAPPVTVSAINLRELAPLAQALDTFSIVYLQWLSNDVMWHARDQTFKRQLEALKYAWAYDLAGVATAIQEALKDAARDAVVRWAAATLPKTTASSSEFEASRLAPWAPVADTSPHAHRPGSVVRPRASTMTPPMK